MKPFRHLRYAFESAWQSFHRNASVSFAAVISIGLVLILAGISLLIGHALDQVLQGYRQKVSVITISVADGTTLPTVYEFEAQLRARPDVSSVSFLTKQQVMDQLASNPQNQQLIQQVQGNPVPAEIEVHVRSLSSISQINALARRWVGVDPTNPTDYQGPFINNVLRLSQWLTLGGLALLGILVLVSIVIVMNTIRTAVFHRRHEIEVMKLVGATEWFVRWPFLIEGVLTGLIAAALAVGVVTAGYQPFVERFHSQLFFVPLSYDPTFVTTLGIELLGGGALLGALGSFIGVRRYVRI
ncbi:MAG TPA: permease-like cell division protein FtsX [Candidatus Dormibacteraeota bacterium]|jgi:cell division transport system permease protein|nr:permease-like cell division protein FtsX [Candidatus Dormibacteraeota bacterium]